MALELGPHGILVNGVAPGSILTEGTQQLFYGEDGKFQDSVQTNARSRAARPAGHDRRDRRGRLFLAAPENSYIHGHILTVDGGWTAGYARDF